MTTPRKSTSRKAAPRPTPISAPPASLKDAIGEDLRAARAAGEDCNAEIARRCGVNAETVYSWFDSRDRLLNHVQIEACLKVTRKHGHAQAYQDDMDRDGQPGEFPSLRRGSAQLGLHVAQFEANLEHALDDKKLSREELLMLLADLQASKAWIARVEAALKKVPK